MKNFQNLGRYNLMKNTMCLIFTISFLLSACGGENPVSNDILFKEYEDIFDDLIIVSQSGLEQILELEEDRIENEENPREDELGIEEEHEQEEIIEQKIPEIFILMNGGYIYSQNIYIVRAMNIYGIIKEIEYEYEHEAEVSGGDLCSHKFANSVYYQMNDDSIPALAQFDKIPYHIIELIERVETLDLDKSRGFGAGNWTYFVIIGTDEDRRVVFIGYRWGTGGSLEGGANELTRAINEYLETTEIREP
ncbi:MAG: hypothetical protein LBD23_15590 [Oscillospiraceae bacterium]|jgi:hypothetical protein|nr:hypothetical protein [Oscillospiraceae bacterium]